jgi:hypothetical protein
MIRIRRLILSLIAISLLPSKYNGQLNRGAVGFGMISARTSFTTNSDYRTGAFETKGYFIHAETPKRYFVASVKIYMANISPRYEAHMITFEDVGPAGMPSTTRDGYKIKFQENLQLQGATLRTHLFLIDPQKNRDFHLNIGIGYNIEKIIRKEIVENEYLKYHSYNGVVFGPPPDNEMLYVEHYNEQTRPYLSEGSDLDQKTISGIELFINPRLNLGQRFVLGLDFSVRKINNKKIYSVIPHKPNAMIAFGVQLLVEFGDTSKSNLQPSRRINRKDPFADF